jgi:hypothetical protein
MESVLIEYLRLDNLDTAVLRGGDRYILAHKELPVKQVTTPVSQYELLKKLKECLRYKSNISAEEKWKTIVEISGVIKPFFIDIAGFGYKNCQLDLVLSASELGLLPFELLLDDNQIPWFADAEKNIALTRRVRLGQMEKSLSWPFTPKVLFIYAHGGFQEVPFERHQAAFDFALNKWGGTGNDKVYKILAEPTFEVLSAELKANDEAGKQYTHVHLLAHGDLILDRDDPGDFEYGIKFGKGDSPTTNTLAIKELFESLAVKPFVVNYMICDGANFSNPLKADKNPVQVTHKAGVPMVLGSQYPLSMEGSVRITNKLYAALFNGNDIREILTDIRLDLFKKKEEHHDWISLVSYIRLPEGYSDYLYKVALTLEMQSLKSAKGKADILLLKKNVNDDDFLEVITSLKNSIAALEKKLDETGNDPRYQNETLENIGLLGSAFKRLAELYFIMRRVKNKETIADEKDALEQALQYYKKASERNLSHHWSLVQYISLDIVLNKELSDMDYWYTARKAANQAIAKNKDDEYAYGSLLELLFLGPVTLNQNEALIDKALTGLVDACNKVKAGTYALETTWFQLNRYNTWWIPSNAYNITNAYLTGNRAVLDKVLTSIKTAISEYGTV